MEEAFAVVLGLGAVAVSPFVPGLRPLARKVIAGGLGAADAVLSRRRRRRRRTLDGPGRRGPRRARRRPPEPPPSSTPRRSPSPNPEAGGGRRRAGPGTGTGSHPIWRASAPTTAPVPYERRAVPRTAPPPGRRVDAERAGRGTAVSQRKERSPTGSGRLTRLLVLVLLGAAAAAAVAQLGLLAVTWSAPTGRELPGPVASIGFVLGSFAFGLVGALIAWSRPANPIGWLCLGLAVVDLGQDVVGRYLAYTLLVAPETPLPSLTAAGSLLPGAWLAPAGCFLVLLIVFPRGRPSSRWMTRVAWGIPLLAAASLALSAVQPGPLPPPFDAEDNVLGLAGADGSADLALVPATAVALLGLLAAADMVRRFRRATGDERQQFKWFAYLTGWVPVLLLVWTALSVLAPDRVAWLETLFPFLLVSVPVAIGTSVLKYRLYDIDVVINRTLVYGALSACVVACYALTVGALGAAFRAQGDLAVSLVATGVAAVLFQPLRQRLQRGVNRLLYGERDDPYAVLARLGRRLEATLTPDAVLPAIVQTVREALRLPYVALRLAAGPADPARTGRPARGRRGRHAHPRDAAAAARLPARAGGRAAAGAARAGGAVQPDRPAPARRPLPAGRRRRPRRAPHRRPAAQPRAPRHGARGGAAAAAARPARRPRPGAGGPDAPGRRRARPLRDRPGARRRAAGRPHRAAPGGDGRHPPPRLRAAPARPRRARPRRGPAGAGGAPRGGAHADHGRGARRAAAVAGRRRGGRLPHRAGGAHQRAPPRRGAPGRRRAQLRRAGGGADGGGHRRRTRAPPGRPPRRGPRLDARARGGAGRAVRRGGAPRRRHPRAGDAAVSGAGCREAGR